MNQRQKWIMALGLGVVFVVFIFSYGKTSYAKYDEVPGIDEIYPTTVIAGEEYLWNGVILSALERDQSYNFENIGRINHIGGTVVQNDCDIICTFEIKGQFYRTEKDPENVYAFVNTDWLTKKWVLFSPKDKVDVEARIKASQEQRENKKDK